MKLLNNFLIGCDPEFGFLGKNERGKLEVVPQFTAAPRYWQHGGRIGSDHGGMVMEFRPKAKYRVGDVVKQLKFFVETLRQSVREKERGKTLKWISGPIVSGNARRDTQPIGGHVHIGLWYTGDDTKKVRAMADFSIWTRKVRLFNARYINSRLHSGFGGLTDYREGDDYKNDYDYNTGALKYSEPGHLEYRSLPSWLYAPRVALLCMTGIKLAIVKPNLWRHINEHFPNLWVATKEALKVFHQEDEDAEFLYTLMMDEYPKISSWRTPKQHNFVQNWMKKKGLGYCGVIY